MPITAPLLELKTAFEGAFQRELVNTYSEEHLVNG